MRLSGLGNLLGPRVDQKPAGVTGGTVFTHEPGPGGGSPLPGGERCLPEEFHGIDTDFPLSQILPHFEERHNAAFLAEDWFDRNRRIRRLEGGLSGRRQTQPWQTYGAADPIKAGKLRGIPAWTGRQQCAEGGLQVLVEEAGPPDPGHYRYRPGERT